MNANQILKEWERESGRYPRPTPVQAARQLYCRLDDTDQLPRLRRLLRILVTIGEDEAVMRKRLRELDP